MNKTKTLVLMLCFILSGALCYASGAAGTENEKGKGIPIDVKKHVNVGGVDKSLSIIIALDDHVLTVSFSENLGQVAIEITTATGALVDCTSLLTPNGIQYYLPNVGDYIVTFTLSDGDEYYGEFTVTD